MNAVLLLIAGIVLLGLAKNVPTWIVLGIVTLLALHYRQQVRGNTAAITARNGEAVAGRDPWARPSAADLRLDRRGLAIALNRTELCSVFPGRGL